LFKKILDARTAQIIEARAAGKLKSPEQPPSMVQPPLAMDKSLAMIDPHPRHQFWFLKSGSRSRR
jgi:hypothetical protein